MIAGALVPKAKDDSVHALKNSARAFSTKISCMENDFNTNDALCYEYLTKLINSERDFFIIREKLRKLSIYTNVQWRFT